MSTNVSYDNLHQMYTDLIKTNKLLKLDINNYYKKKNTNERKVYYEIGNIDNVIYYNKLLKIIYFVILGIYILFGNFIGDKQYLKPLVWIMIIVYICVPFFLKYIINRIFDLINASNLHISKKNDDSPLSSCFNINDANNANDLDDDTGDNNDNKVITPPLLIEKCYIRFEGEQCKKHKDVGWSGWQQQNSFDDCYNCNGTTQSGCDAIKNSWSSFCGTNTFNIFTSDSLPGDNVCIVGGQ